MNIINCDMNATDQILILLNNDKLGIVNIGIPIGIQAIVLNESVYRKALQTMTRIGQWLAT